MSTTGPSHSLTFIQGLSYFEDLDQGHLVIHVSLGLNTLMSETNRLVTLADKQDRHKLSDEFPLELLALECLKSSFDIVSCIATLTFLPILH